MIQKIFKRESVAPPGFCELCLFETFYRRGSDPWMCTRCFPPKGQERIELHKLGNGYVTFEADGTRLDASTVAANASKPITSVQIQNKRLIAETTILNAMCPVCRECFSQQYVETVFVDGSVEMRFLCCKADVDGVPMLEHSPRMKGGLTKRQFDDV